MRKKTLKGNNIRNSKAKSIYRVIDPKYLPQKTAQDLIAYKKIRELIDQPLKT